MNSTLSTANLLSSVTALEVERNETVSRLHDLKAGSAKKVTAAERQAVDEEWKKMCAVAKRREKIAMEFWGVVEDGTEDREKLPELREGWGLDE